MSWSCGIGGAHGVFDARQAEVPGLMTESTVSEFFQQWSMKTNGRFFPSRLGPNASYFSNGGIVDLVMVGIAGLGFGWA